MQTSSWYGDAPDANAVSSLSLPIVPSAPRAPTVVTPVFRNCRRDLINMSYPSVPDVVIARRQNQVDAGLHAVQAAESVGVDRVQHDLSHARRHRAVGQRQVE